ncbi:MAG: murein biosynthesis integral membrane protein MurJ, partial [Gammaproteobacteria bacterium]
FFVAFKIPNYLRRIFGEGAFSQAFVPVLNEVRSKQGEAEAHRLINHVTGSLGMILFGVTVVGIVAAPLLIMLFAPGFIGEPDKFDLSVDLLRITFPYIFFISLTALAGGVLNTYGRFGVPAITPVLLNVALILAAIFLSPRLEEPITALAWGVFIAGAVQLLFQLPFLARIRMLPRPQSDWHYAGVKRIITLMIPALFAVSISQINLIIGLLLASFLQEGSITWLYNSDRIMEFPLGVFGVALATVILPDLSRRHAEGATHEFSRVLDWALRWAVLITLPAMLGMVLLAGPVLTTIFQYGEFTPRHMSMTSLSLITYSLGLSGHVLIKIFASGYFSRQDTRTPVKAGVAAIVANTILCLVFVVPLQHAGLALATSLAAYVNAGLLYYFLRKRQVYHAQAGWVVYMLRVGGACLLMSTVLLFYVPDVDVWMSWGVVNRVLNLVIWVTLGMIIYVMTLLLLGLRPRHMTVAGH